MAPDQIERMNISRALCIASWASIFNLITTDILGPFNAQFAISQVGWVPGIILYFYMGLAALYTGLILWRLFIHLDSVRYPLKTYADIAERIFGRTARHACNILQSIQLLVNVATICLRNSQSLAQITEGKLCFSVAILIWPIVGVVLGQIRTLKNDDTQIDNFGYHRINLLIIFISMGVIAHHPPNFNSAQKTFEMDPGPVMTIGFGYFPLFHQVNGIMNMVFAYGGAMIFPEMARTYGRDAEAAGFVEGNVRWKAIPSRIVFLIPALKVMAQALIFSAYLLCGVFIYMSLQGQFTLPLAYRGISSFAWQTVGNILALVTGIIAAATSLPSEVIYINVVEERFEGPPLLSTRGRLTWSVLVTTYCSLAFVIGSAIPKIASIVGLIAAIAIMQCTYTFSPLFRFGYDVSIDAMSGDVEFVPGQGTKNRIDSWREWSRWKRSLFSGKWYFKLFNLLFSLGALAMACLGMWGAGESIRAAFEISTATSFGRAAPVWLFRDTGLLLQFIVSHLNYEFTC
ncbi:hypothetical protein AX16_000833 [Volvariella volvacea WC 439]|nr:hypothetical protein AX16_000833 [Volvariella volvacea WC 439]